MKTNTILRYLNNEMSLEELKKFEGLMASDAELQKAVEEHKAIDLVSDAVMEQQLLDEVRGVASSLNSTSRTKITWQSILLIVGAIVLLTVLGLYFIKAMDKSADFDPQVYAQALYEAPAWPVERGSPDYISLGIGAGLSGNMERATSYLTDSLSDTDTGNYWLAQLLYQNENYEEGVSRLNMVNNDAKLFHKAEHLKVLSLLNLDRTDEVRAILKVSDNPLLQDMKKDILN